MKKNNRILALINIDEPINTLMESTVNLAETLQADVHFFYVKKPIDLTLTENQIAVLRTKVQAEKAVMKLKNALAQIRKRTHVKLDYTITLGNVKKSIKTEIKSYNPSLIVLGKRMTNTFRFVGSQITEFVLNDYEGPVLITHPTEVLEFKENLSLGVLNDFKMVEKNSFTHELIRYSKEPIRQFTIEDDSALTEDKSMKDTETVNYTFVNNENALKSLTTYVHKNNVHLLCLNRIKKQKTNKTITLNEVLKSIDTSMLMIGNNQFDNLIKV